MSETIETYRWSVDEYHKLISYGVFGEDDRLELLNGDLVIMSPFGWDHVNTVRRLNNLFARKIAGRCLIDCQNAFTLSMRSEPQPDFLLLRADLPEMERLPGPEDILLLVEVADSLLSYDRGVKLQAYASGGIREVWILNLKARVVECYRQPEGLTYTWSVTKRFGDTLEAEAVPGVTFAVEELIQ